MQEIQTHFDYDSQGRQTKIIYNYQDGVTGPGSGEWTYFQVDNNSLTGYSQVLAEVSTTGSLSKTYTYAHDLIAQLANPQTLNPVSTTTTAWAARGS